MEPNRKNSILQCLGDNNENISSNILREMFIKSEINSQESDANDDYITLENFKLKVEKTNNETVPSVEEAISNLKTEVEFSMESNESSKIDSYRNLEKEIERKRKLSASELTDYLNSTMSKRNKAKIHESTVTETTEKNVKNPTRTLVYTTRLDEMRVFRNNLRKLNCLIIWEEILRESKPVYNYLQHTTKSTKRTCKRKKLRKLYNDLKIINDKKGSKESEQTIHNEEITCESTKECSQPKIISNDKSDHKVFDNTDLCQTKDEVEEFEEVEKDEDLKHTLNERNNRNTSLTDTISNNSPMLSKILQTNTVIKTENIYKSETVMKVAKLLLESKLESNESLPGRRKSDVQDPAIVAPDALIRNMLCSVVYTTRLNDMLVLRKTLKFLDGKYVLREILRESKPNVKHLKRKTNAKSVNRISFKQLQIQLQNLNNKNKNKCVEIFNSAKKDNYDLVPTDLFQIKKQSDYARILLDPKICNETDTEGYANTSNSKSNLCVYNPHVQIIEKIEVNRNIALIIYNNISKLIEIYITDNGGNVTEYRKSINCNPLVNIIDFTKQIDPTKQIIKLTTCCWFHRKMNIDKIWSNTNIGIARFVQSKHECLPGSCKCCCKPKLVSNSFKIFVDVNNEVENKYVKDVKVNSLIARALDYRRPNKEKSRDIFLPTLDQPVFVQINKCQGGKNGKEIEYYAIDSKGMLDWQIKLYTNDYNLNNAINHLKRTMTRVREVMCNREEKNQFICLLKESNIPFNVIKYLKGKKGFGKSNEMDITPRIPTVRLIMETPHIEHTRKCTLATLIKIKDIINYTTVMKKSITAHENKNDRSRQNLNPEPSTSGMCLLKTNLPPNKTIPDIVLKDPQKLIITCEEFPEIETTITNVDPTIATTLLDEFKHISFVAKTGKLIATMLSKMQNGNPEGFKILAKIIHLTQTKMKHLMISSEMKIQLHIRSESMKRENIGVTKKSNKEETIVDNVEETTKYGIFTNFITYDKKLYKKSFESYIKHEGKKGGKTDKVVMPIISNVFSLNDKSTNLNNETTKNDFIDSFASTSFNYDVRNETSQFAMPIHGNYLQINSQQSQILHLSSSTIVENTISTILNKNNPPAVVGQSVTGLQHADVQIPVNFIIDKNIVCDLINSLPNNTVNRNVNNLILKSLLNKKS